MTSQSPSLFENFNLIAFNMSAPQQANKFVDGIGEMLSQLKIHLPELSFQAEACLESEDTHARKNDPKYLIAVKIREDDILRIDTYYNEDRVVDVALWLGKKSPLLDCLSVWHQTITAELDGQSSAGRAIDGIQVLDVGVDRLGFCIDVQRHGYIASVNDVSKLLTSVSETLLSKEPQDQPRAD